MMVIHGNWLSMLTSVFLLFIENTAVAAALNVDDGVIFGAIINSECTFYNIVSLCFINNTNLK